MDEDGPLVSYGESVGPPLIWNFSGVNGEWRQQCDDERELERRWCETRGLYYDTEGEAIGDFV